jgi:hypothetical protein
VHVAKKFHNLGFFQSRQLRAKYVFVREEFRAIHDDQSENCGKEVKQEYVFLSVFVFSKKVVVMLSVVRLFPFFFG